ncbi:MAG: tungstate ABC transporter substrate-binding protein WtpA [Synergistaceae bacterium]|nr:tungstate ABC transporter substrate-binding protein WtpA [Synergistaceae bacterium]
MCNTKALQKFLIVVSAVLMTAAFAGGALAAEKITVYHAGSLSAPMAKIEALYEAANPGVDVLRESGGSAALARKITDLGGACDVFLSADYMVIEKLLRPAGADWNVTFASNAIVLMYGPKSKYKDEINAKNWTKVMMRPDVNWGHSEPDADPCGYRSLLVLQLAEKHYGDKGLYERAMKDPQRAVRQKAIELVAMVESGTMDYAFEYKSVAVQHKLNYVELPKEINLMDPANKTKYETVSIELAGKEPGKKITVKGEPIVYGLTIPKTAPHSKGAVDFVKFVLDPKGGLPVFQSMGQDVVGPSSFGNAGNIPAEIKPLLK